jgi:hypothetical protein
VELRCNAAPQCCSADYCGAALQRNKEGVVTFFFLLWSYAATQTLVQHSKEGDGSNDCRSLLFSFFLLHNEEGDDNNGCRRVLFSFFFCCTIMLQRNCLFLIFVLLCYAFLFVLLFLFFPSSIAKNATTLY